MRLVAFTGLKGSGKDTAAAVFVEAGYTHVKFASCLKQMLLNLLSSAGVAPDIADRMVNGDLKEAPHAALSGETPRWAMQTLGTEWGRRLMHDAFWVNIVRQRLKSLDRVVISDVRFPNEVDLIRELRGSVYRVDRGLGPVDPHESEALIQTLNVDGALSNSGTVDQFRDLVRELLLP